MAKEKIIEDTIINQDLRKKDRIKIIFRSNIVFVALVVVIAVFGFISPNFFRFENILNIGRQLSILSIMAFGMTPVIISGNIDLSVGATLAMASMTTALTIQATDQVILGVIVGLATGAFIGFLNGFLSTKGGIPSFLTTLGMMGAVRGFAMIITSTLAVQVYNQKYWSWFGDGKIGFLPTSIMWTIIAFVFIHVLLRYSTLGRYIYAVGGNLRAANFTGIKTDKVVIWSFVICGIFSALAGIILSSRMHAARPNIGEGYELNAIAAIILGGASLFGGKGNVIGTLLGALVIGTLGNGLILIGFDTYVQTMVRGIVIIAAVLFAGREKV
ncbi:MAG: ABC transporter permease [Actinobacteria bacterium]|nr:ABC transporter permease [Cyanobacteriota bacterium]MCL5771928.1 ABC transporter permease [Actinomycetota bacterium]